MSRGDGFGELAVSGFVGLAKSASAHGWRRGWLSASRLVSRMLPAARCFAVQAAPVGEIWIDLGETVCFPAIVERNAYQPETTILRSMTRAGDVVYDIGANFGWTTLVLADRVGHGGRVIAFEPAPPAIRLLRTNIQGKFNVAVYELALSNFTGKAPFFVAARLDLSSLTADRTGDPIRCTHHVRVDSLDGVISRERLPLPQIIKCDVEGGELRLFQGSRQVLAHGPMVLFEFVPRFAAVLGYTLEELIASLLSALPTGTRLYSVLRDGSLAERSGAPVANPVNLLAVPPSFASRTAGLLQSCSGVLNYA